MTESKQDLRNGTKAKIISVSDNEIHLLCSSHSFKTGEDVIIQDASKGTNPQNRFFHKLIQIWVSSGCSSYEGDEEKVKDFVKRDYGEKFKSYVYIDDNFKFADAIKWNEIPEHIQQDKTRIRGKLKSWGRYTKPQRMKCIQRLIDNMIASGVNSKDFDNICKEFLNV